MQSPESFERAGDFEHTESSAEGEQYESSGDTSPTRMFTTRGPDRDLMLAVDEKPTESVQPRTQRATIKGKEQDVEIHTWSSYHDPDNPCVAGTH